MTADTVVAAALELAGNGIPVFPCWPVGSGVNPKTKKSLDKSPHVAAWGSVASTSAEDIQSWWKKWPDALLAVPTGIQSGLFVLDLDVKKGRDGPAEIARRQLPVPDTRVNWTLSGGQHALYLVPNGSACPTNSDVIAPGIDLRGDGGYIIWWPAHGGKVEARPLVPAPEWMTKKEASGPSMPPMGISDEDIEELLSLIDPVRMESRSEWIKLGMALHHETEGDMVGLQMWNEASSKWPKYEGIETLESEWATFGRGRGKAVTLRSYVPPGWRRHTPSASEVFGKDTKSADPVQRDESRFFTAADQLAYFKGCVYVHTTHEVIGPDGTRYGQEQFNVAYGGASFVMGETNERVIRSAWEAFTQSPAIEFPKVYSTVFRPENKCGEIITLEDKTFVNTYRPIKTLSIEGDPQPFLTLLNKMVPDLRDQSILLTYMASMVRNPGSKFQWWPVMQGTEGNGKSAFIRILSHCVGSIYSHTPNVSDIAKNGLKFNSWLAEKLFLGFEEVYVPNRRDFLEDMKATVTNDRVQLERKGKDQMMCDNRANGFMCTNHKDGVPITVDNRRYAVFFTAQQSAEDKLRDGMGGNYFVDLYNWFNGKGKYGAGGLNYGYGVTNWYLRNGSGLIVPEFDPADECQVAPATTSKSEAVSEGQGMIEQEILEAIDSGDQQGFRNGWISSVAINRLMGNLGRKMSLRARTRMLEGMGYIKHPGLRDGRAGHATMIDGGAKPRLYVKRDSTISKLTDPAIITAAYIKAQNP